MIHWILRWIIGQSIDSGRPLPKWLQSRIDRDSKLQEYQHQIELLVTHLRRDAACIGPDSVSHSKVDLADLHRDSTSSSIRSYRRMYGLGAALAAAASMTFLFFYFDSTSDKIEITDVAPPTRIQNNLDEVETRKIREQLLAASRSLSDRITTEYKSKKELLESRRLLDQFPTANQLVETTESIGAASVKPLTMLSEGMRQERVRVENDIRNGITYFSRTVPKRMMSLVLNK